MNASYTPYISYTSKECCGGDGQWYWKKLWIVLRTDVEINYGGLENRMLD